MAISVKGATGLRLFGVGSASLERLVSDMEASGEGLFVKYPSARRCTPKKYPQQLCACLGRPRTPRSKKPGSPIGTGLFEMFLRSLGMLENVFLAERAGFEPAVGINPHTLSRRAT
jgi:hypothetical protein